MARRARLVVRSGRRHFHQPPLGAAGLPSEVVERCTKARRVPLIGDAAHAIVMVQVWTAPNLFGGRSLPCDFTDEVAEVIVHALRWLVLPTRFPYRQ